MALVVRDVSDGICTLTLNDPDRLNAMGEEMAQEFAEVVRGLKNSDKTFRSIILTGAGRAFSAGGNLEMLKAKTMLSPEENRLRMLAFYNSFLSIRDLNVPLIAAINGHAIGAGLCVACACDIRVISRSAKLGFTFTKLGLHPGMGATWFLPNVIGPSRAIELMLTGRIVVGEEVESLGLAARVVEEAKVLETSRDIASQIKECGPEATRQLLETLRSGSASLEQSLGREATCQSLNYKSDEFLEGVQATIEKRKPLFAH